MIVAPFTTSGSSIRLCVWPLNSTSMPATSDAHSAALDDREGGVSKFPAVFVVTVTREERMVQFRGEGAHAVDHRCGFLPLAFRRSAGNYPPLLM